MSTQNLKSNQGQQAGELRLSYEDLSENEQQLVCFLGQEGRPVFTIKEMMEGLNWHRGRTGRARGNSKVRNTLRRLVRSHWVGHKSDIGDGRYRITLQGLHRLEKLAEGVSEASNENTGDKPRKHKPAKKTTEAQPEPETTTTETVAIPAPEVVTTTEAKPETTATEEEF